MVAEMISFKEPRALVCIVPLKDCPPWLLATSLKLFFPNIGSTWSSSPRVSIAVAK